METRTEERSSSPLLPLLSNFFLYRTPRRLTVDKKGADSFIENRRCSEDPGPHLGFSRDSDIPQMMNTRANMLPNYSGLMTKGKGEYQPLTIKNKSSGLMKVGMSNTLYAQSNDLVSVLLISIFEPCQLDIL